MAASAGAVAVTGQSLADQEQAVRGFIERVPTVDELFEAGEFEKAIALLDPIRTNPRRFFVKVLRTKNAELVRAFAEKSCPHRPHLWEWLFIGIATLPVCQVLWPLRHYAENQKAPVTQLLMRMMKAASEGDHPYFIWALQVLREMNCLHELNRPKGGVSYPYERPDSRYPKERGIKERRLYASPLIAAADNSRFEMVRLLLMHGADPLLEGYSDVCRADCCGGGREYIPIRELIKSFTSVRSLILGFIKEPSVAVNDEYYQRVFKAVLYRPEFASEYVTGKAGSTLLHGAVIAQNRKLILLCLVYNRALIEAKSEDGFTPLRLAIGGYREALQVILDFCYTKSQPKP